jgi:L-threonylcarbamoyladenylate synthase
VADQLGDRIDLIIDGGPCTVGIESTILDLTSPHPTVLRPGGISHEALENVLGISIEALSLKEQEPKTVLAPGMLRTHYAPRTPLLLVDDRTAIPHYDRIGVISLSEHSTIFDSVSATHRAAFSAEGQLEEVSQNLFRVLREFDTLDLDIILVERCASQGLGRAIVDRLQRASVR